MVFCAPVLAVKVVTKAAVTVLELVGAVVNVEPKAVSPVTLTFPDPAFKFRALVDVLEPIEIVFTEPVAPMSMVLAPVPDAARLMA